MLLVVGPVEPTPFGCLLSTLEGWCVACDVADPWPSAAAPLPDIFPSIVYRSSLSLSLTPTLLSLSLLLCRLLAGRRRAKVCKVCLSISAAPTEQLRKKTTPRHEGCVAPTKRNGTWIGKSWPQYQLAFSTLTRFFYAFVREEPQMYSSSGFSFSGANHRPIRVLSSHGKDFQSVDQFSRHQATTTRIRAFFSLVT